MYLPEEDLLLIKLTLTTLTSEWERVLLGGWRSDFNV